MQVAPNTSVTVNATAQDNVGVARVEFFVNNILKCTDAMAPYACVFQTPSTIGTSISIEARAYDTAGLWSARGIQVTTK